MAERDQFSAGVGSGIYGSGESVGNIVFSIPPNVPSKPENFVASNSTYTNKVLLTWTKISNVSYYKIYRNSDLLTQTVGAVLENTNDSTNSPETLYYEDTTAIPGIVYNYVMSAVNNSGESILSDFDSGSVKLSTTTPTVTNLTFNDKINLSWTQVTGATTYAIYKSSSSEFDDKTVILIETANLSYSDTELTPGETYYYSIVAKSNSEECDSEFSPFIIGKTSIILDTPTVTASNGSSVDHVSLSWNTIRFATYYEIYRDGVLIDIALETQYNDIGATPGILHTYQVIAKSSSAASTYDTDSGTTGYRKLNIVGVGLVASNGLHEDKIVLNWNSITGATGYRLYRGTTWVDPSNNMTLIATSNGSTFTYSDTNTDLDYNTNYYYSIVATSSVSGATSDYLNLETFGRLKTPVPSAPTNLLATDGTHEDKVSLTWSSVTTASFYEIYRDGVFVDTSTTNSYNDFSSSVIPGTQYTYSLKSVNNFGEKSSLSGTNTGYKKLSAPILNSASDSFYETKIVLIWSESAGATSYQIYRGTTSSTASMSIIDTVGSTTFTYNDTYTDLTVDTLYYYSIKAVSALSTSNFSNVDYGSLLDTTEIIPDNIAAPTGLTATTGGSNSVVLNWNYSGDSTTFRIWRNGTPINTVSASIRTYTDTTATPGQNISYQISTTNRSGTNLFSNTATGSVKLSKPSINVSGGSSTTEIVISWPIVVGATGYILERSVDGVVFSQIETPTATTYSDTNTDLAYNQNYYYRVKATCATTALNSDYSNTRYGYLLPPVPSAFTLIASDGTDSTAVNLSWTASVNAYSYRILRGGAPVAFSRSNLLIKSENPAGNISGVYPPVGYANYGNAVKSFTTATETLPIGGTGSVTTITYTTGDVNSGIYQNIPAIEEGAWYIVSVYAKGTGTFRMSYYDGTDSFFSDTTEGTSTRATSVRTITDIDTSKDFTLTSSWQRYSFIFRATRQSDPNPNIRRTKNYHSNITIANGSNNGIPTISLWGIQLEKVLTNSDVVGSYITTTNLPVIRTTFSDTVATDYTTHTYQVVAGNISGNTNSNNNTGFKKPLQPVLKSSPSQTNNIFIDVEFENGGVNGTTFSLYRGNDQNTNNDTNDINFSLIHTQTGNSVVSYVDTDVNLKTNVKYYYKAKVTFSGIDSEFSLVDFSNPSHYGSITALAAPTGPQDYALFGLAFHSFNEGAAIINEASWVSQPTWSLVKTISSVKVYNPDYAWKAIIPSITPPSNPSPSYNGSRHPTSTIYTPSSSSWNWFTQHLNIIPANRRAIALYAYYTEIGQPYHKVLVDYYTGTDSLPKDGYKYNSKRFLMPWADNWYNDAKSHWNGFVKKSVDSGLIFDYLVDNKEFMRHWLILGGGYNTNTIGSTFGDSRVVYGGRQTSDSRILSAVFENPKFKTQINPITNKTFEQEFIYHFEQIWNNDVFHGAASTPKPLPLHPSGRSLVADDLIKYILTETEREKTLSAISNDGILAAQSRAVSAGSYRIRMDNLWTFYSCGTGAGTQEYNSATNSCSSIMGSHNWRANWFLSYYSSVSDGLEADKTTQGFISGQVRDPDLKTWYDTWLNPSIVGNPRITGYVLHRMVTWAWNATVDSWMFNYYTRSMFMDSLRNTNNPQLNHVKYTNYEMVHIDAKEKQFFQDSNIDQWYRINIDQYCGESLYGAPKNILFASGETNYTLQSCLNNSGVGPWSSYGETLASWKNIRYLQRSGYVKTPLTDHEKYSWSGNGSTVYGGPGSVLGSSNHVKYPETPLLDASDNWIGNASQNGKKWVNEYIYKMLVNDVKDMRHFYRSSEYYSPWPSLGPSNNGVTSDVQYKYEIPYWYEMFFHALLNMKNEFINLYNASYNPSDTNGYRHAQHALDEWRNISINRVGVPCTNQTCNPSLQIDRLILCDAFEKCLISGKKFTDTNTYLWRITVAPKFFNSVTGIAILDRVDNTNEDNSDLPSTITIKYGGTSLKELSSSRGVWLRRNKAGIPHYQPRLP